MFLGYAVCYFPYWSSSQEHVTWITCIPASTEPGDRLLEAFVALIFKYRDEEMHVL